MQYYSSRGLQYRSTPHKYVINITLMFDPPPTPMWPCPFSALHFPLGSSPPLFPLLYCRTLPSFLPSALLISSTRFYAGYISLSLRGNKNPRKTKRELLVSSGGRSVVRSTADPLITAIIAHSGLGLLC